MNHLIRWGFFLIALKYGSLTYSQTGRSENPIKHTVAQSQLETQKAEQIVMITSFQGLVEVFIPESRARDAQSFVVFEGQKYGSVKPRVGLKLKEGDMVRTGNDGKAKLIYSNGDVFILGSASAFTVPTKVTTAHTYESEVLYGRVRAMIDKKGPLSQIQIKTKTAVSGVRGTDLVILYNPLKEYTEIHVLRGEVQVQNQAKASMENPNPTLAPPTLVKSGYKAEVIQDKPSQVTASTQGDLNKIKTETLVVAASKPNSETKEFEKKAVEKVIEDIKETQGGDSKLLIAQLNEGKTLEEIGSAVVDTLASKAPEGPKKPKRTDFLYQDEDVYKKFFKK